MADRFSAKPTNFRGMQGHLREAGMTLKKTPHGEYKVNHKGGKEATAYYTNDLGDAGMTGFSMARRHLEKETERGEHSPTVGGHKV